MADAIALRIYGMTCTSCASQIQEALEKVPGVRSASVSYPEGVAKVAAEAGVSQDALSAAVATLGYRVTTAKGAPTQNPPGLLGKALEWLGGATQTGKDGGKPHVVIIGSGGGAFAGAIKAV